jgi:MGT family glycosyltransferase
MLHRAPLTLAVTGQPFEYPRDDWPATIRFVGPLSWEPELPAPEWLAHLDDRPLVLMTASSIGRAAGQPLLSAAILGLGDEPIQIVATLDSARPPLLLPDNLRIEGFVPHGRVLPQAACVICHGGIGIVQKALAAGVPVVAVPDAYDRFEVARRVEVAGAGVMIPARKLTPGNLRRGVRRAIASRGGAERIARAFSEAGGSTAAADAFEAILPLELGAQRPPWDARSTYS